MDLHATIMSNMEDSEVIGYIDSHLHEINVIDEFHQSPLHLAALTNRPKIVDKLLQCGAYGTCDIKENTPLHIAAQDGYNAVVDEILKSCDYIELRNCDQWTALHLAAKNKHYEILKKLIAYTDINILGGYDDRTILHIACANNDLYLVRLLIKYNCNINALTFNCLFPADMTDNEFILKELNDAEYNAP
jgi:ankyrin repeat protein